MQKNGHHDCGGSLIADRVVITAAHCINPNNTNLLTVRLGSTNISSGGEIINVTSVLVHEDWLKHGLENDIALLFLEFPPKVPNAKIIALPLKNTPIPRTENVCVTGWGSTQPRGNASQILQEVIIPYIPLERCQYLYRFWTGKVTDKMICAGVDGKGGKDSCSGDSGGPAVIDGKLAGIVSWGNGCALPDYPGVYTRVDKFIDWIDEHLPFK